MCDPGMTISREGVRELKSKEGIDEGSNRVPRGIMKGTGVPRADRGYEHMGFAAAVLHSTSE